MLSSAVVAEGPDPKTLDKPSTLRSKLRCFSFSKRALTAGACSLYYGSCRAAAARGASWFMQSPALSCGSIPGEKFPSERAKHDVGPKSDDADNDDRGVNVGEVLISRLLGNEPGDARSRADKFRDDEIRPRPPEKDALIAIEVGKDA